LYAKLFLKKKSNWRTKNATPPCANDVGNGYQFQTPCNVQQHKHLSRYFFVFGYTKRFQRRNSSTNFSEVTFLGSCILVRSRSIIILLCSERACTQQQTKNTHTIDISVLHASHLSWTRLPSSQSSYRCPLMLATLMCSKRS
jgi:hypothetical protein